MRWPLTLKLRSLLHSRRLLRSFERIAVAQEAQLVLLTRIAEVIAPTFGPLIGGVLETAFGWQSIFLFVAAASLAIFAWAAAILPETRQRHAGSLAAAGEELLAQGDQIFRGRRAARAAQQAAAALAQGLQQLVQEGIGHGESDRGVVG